MTGKITHMNTLYTHTQMHINIIYMNRETHTCLALLSCGALIDAELPPAADDSRMIMNISASQAQTLSLSRSPSLSLPLPHPHTLSSLVPAPLLTLLQKLPLFFLLYALKYPKMDLSNYLKKDFKWCTVQWQSLLCSRFKKWKRTNEKEL